MNTIDHDLGMFSEQFMLFAGITYTVAFLFFAWDMITSRVAQREAVAAGSAAASSASPAKTEDQGAFALQVSDADSSLTGTTNRGNLDELSYQNRGHLAARIAVSVSILGLVIHAVAVLTRALAAHRVPWGNMYEFCTTGALVVVAVYLAFLIKKDLRFLGTFVLGLVVIMMTFAVVVFPTPVAPLVPSLQSPWIVIHVSVAVLAAALFTMAFALSLLQVIKTRAVATAQLKKRSVRGFLARVPAAETLENLAYRFTALGFVLWSFTLIAGALWAQKAWGRYWGWDTKEIWTFVIWVVYAGYLHARATRGWTGTRAAWLNMVGYGCVIFNFTVVNIYFAGLHSYSGV